MNSIVSISMVVRASLMMLEKCTALDDGQEIERLYGEINPKYIASVSIPFDNNAQRMTYEEFCEKHLWLGVKELSRRCDLATFTYPIAMDGDCNCCRHNYSGISMKGTLLVDQIKLEVVYS